MRAAARARRRDRQGPGRLLPPEHRALPSAAGRAGGGRSTGAARRVEGLEGTGVRPSRGNAAAMGSGAGAALAVRLVDLGTVPDRAALRLSVPARDLRAGAEAGARLLRLAVPARRPARGPGRPQGRPCRRRLLRVRGAFGEDPVPSPEVAEELAAELVLMAGWLGLDGVVVSPNGDLAPALTSTSRQCHRAVGSDATSVRRRCRAGRR